MQYHGRAPVASCVSVTLCSNAALDVWIWGTFWQFPLMQPIDCAMVGFKTISHTDGMPGGGDSLFPLPLRVFVVLWSRRGAVCLWQPCRVRSNGAAAACVRMVLLCCAGVPQTLPWKTTFLHPLLHCVHSVVSSAIKIP